MNFKIFSNNGDLLQRNTLSKMEFMVISVFGNAEKVTAHNKDCRVIGRCEPKDLDVENYRDYYRVYKDEVRQWSELLKTCSCAKERMEVFKNGYE